MDLFEKLFYNPDKELFSQQYKQNPDEHSVVIRFNYGIDTLDPLHELEDKLEKKIEENGVGNYDGHEIAIDDSHGFLYMYGKNAEIPF